MNIINLLNPGENMIINPNDFATNIPYVHSVLKSDQDRGVSIHDTASLISASIGIPIIATYSIMALQLGMTPEIIRTLDNLKAFYHVDEVIAWKN